MSLETLLRQAQRPLLIAHIAPDGDAIGSLLGLGWAMKELGRWPTLACADPVPESLQFLPGHDEIVSRRKGDEDVIVSLDSSDLLRLGSLYDQELFAALPVVNIDHHVTNVRFGSEQLIEPTAVSTSQIVYDLLRRLDWPVSPWSATCLLTGLITDTRSFRTSNTTAEALRTAVALIEAGAPLAEINGHLEHDIPMGVVTLWGRALSAARLQDGIVSVEVTRKLLRECGVSGGDASGLVSLVAGVRQAQIAVLFTEKPDGRVEVGLRSVPGVDVSGVALALG
ncbi:MAG TPA: bifunctional oligoribonuclease/PAP phosphatase NrnA, partial [Anaerolineae bacterium]|nr:bifunctional oligoribonuclease/PAP phosphatase NrnA [Anaerolineae bacterium]